MIVGEMKATGIPKAIMIVVIIALAYMNIDAMRTKMSVAPCAEPAT